jgi:hypothetical protein
LLEIQFAMTVKSEDNTGEALARLERDITNMKNALGLLGARPCSVCGKFHLVSNPGSLFTACGNPVCYDCFSGWWLAGC